MEQKEELEGLAGTAAATACGGQGQRVGANTVIVKEQHVLMAHDGAEDLGVSVFCLPTPRASS